MMEVEAWMVAVLVVVLSLVFLGIVSTFGMGNKTFEEVMEEQKKAQQLVLSKSKPEKKNKEKKKTKKKATKQVSQEEVAEAPAAEPKKEAEVEIHKMVELEPDPEVIESPLVKKNLDKKQAKEKKPILTNKEERGFIKATFSAEELFHPQSMPMDDVELHHHKQRKISVPKKHVEEPLVEDEIDVTHVKPVFGLEPPMTTDTIPGKKNKKHKASGGSGDSAGKTNQQLITMMKSATLNEADIQSMIEILLNKQGKTSAPVEWTKKGDPITHMKKQLEERDHLLNEEQAKLQGANKKLKDLRQEVNQQKLSYTQLEASNADKMNEQKKEITALQHRMQKSHDQHLEEMNKLHHQTKVLQSQLGAAGGEQVAVQRLSEENKQLREQMAGKQQQFKIMTDEMTKNAVKMNSLEGKVRHYEEELGKMESSKRDTGTVLSKQMNEMTEELRRSEGRNGALQQELENTRQEIKKKKVPTATLR